MIRDMTEQFVEEEVLPQVGTDRAQGMGRHIVSSRNAAANSACSASKCPEKYGGENLDKVSAMIVVGETGARRIVRGFLWRSQRNRHAADRLFRHRRTKAQVPSTALQSRKDFGLCVVGSPAAVPMRLPQRRMRRRSADGTHWVINGEKMWITNAAFADMFITFAQVDGKQFSCFIVEKTTPAFRPAPKRTRWACAAHRHAR